MSNASLLKLPPLSLYVHIPWCVRKCPYCDFNSHEAGDTLNESEYIEALMRDLEQELENIEYRNIQSIFFGGGTPSLFEAASIENILNGIQQRTALADDVEITLEANPGTFEQQRFSDYRAAGINRLSIGIQSFDNNKLEQLGRIHDASDACNAVETAYKAGFENVNLDLMFGLPGQSLQQAVKDITTAIQFKPSHISHYQLTIEPNTYFHKHTPVLPTNDAIWQMQTACHEQLHANGYAQYEVSAFSKSEKRCRHNMNYWLFGDYIGIGAGAHGKITDEQQQNIQRRWKHRQPDAYIEQAINHHACSGTRVLNDEDRLFEFLLNALRLREGFEIQLFEQRTGIQSSTLLDACRAVDPELLVIDKDRIATSRRGYDFLNEVLENFLQPSALAQGH